METYTIASDLLTLRITDSIDNLREDWQTLSHNNIYADPDYLNLLEDAGPYSFKYCYAIIYQNDRAVAAIYFQYKRIELSKDLRLHTHSHNWFEKLSVSVKQTFLKLINQNLLICGNVLLTGEYCFGTDRAFSLNEEILEEVLAAAKKFIKNHWGVTIHSILCKDFFVEGLHKEHSFNLDSFTEFKVQPAMIMNLDPSWETFDDYLQAVRSKYRVKFKKVIKQGSAIEIRSLNEEDMIEYNDRIYELYSSTADRALFSLFKLDQNYFKKLKKCFGDQLIINGMFLENKLIGFYTFVQNLNHGDAHFIGYDVSLNSKYNIYFNILLGLIKEAIQTKSRFLNLSRTALEIKSSVGAEPHEMNIYLRHENALINKMLPFALARIVPKNDWEPRSPFKD